jgi:hypothetical protein
MLLTCKLELYMYYCYYYYFPYQVTKIFSERTRQSLSFLPIGQFRLANQHPNRIMGLNPYTIHVTDYQSDPVLIPANKFTNEEEEITFTKTDEEEKIGASFLQDTSAIMRSDSFEESKMSMDDSKEAALDESTTTNHEMVTKAINMLQLLDKAEINDEVIQTIPNMTSTKIDINAIDTNRARTGQK